MIIKRLSAATRISLSLVGVTITLLLLAQLVGLVPDRMSAILEGRRALCEAMAFDWSIDAQNGNLGAIAASAIAITKRNQDVLSIGLRSADGTLLVDTGDHETRWGAPEGNGATTTHAVVPIHVMPNQKQWGQVEVRFRDPAGGWLPSYLGIPGLGVVIFLAISGLVLYRFYMGRVLRHLDPSKVVPERIRATLNIMSEGVALLEENGRIVLANEILAQSAGVPASELQGKMADSLPWLKPESQDAASDFPWTESLRDGQSRRGVTLRLRTESGEVHIYQVNAAAILGENGKPKGVLVTFDDVSEIEEKNAQLRNTLAVVRESQEEIDRQNKALQVLASRDPLTGCLNRRSFFETAETHWSAAKRYNHHLGCIMVDIDHFKQVNDCHGHTEGDKVLAKLGAILRTECRDSDLVCRYGGEEFCILLLHADTRETVAAAEHIRQAVESARQGIAVTASLGVSSTELKAVDLLQMINQADDALYAAKQGGRNRVIRWEGTLGHEVAKQARTWQDGEHSIADKVHIPMQAVSALLSALAQRDVTTAEHSRQVAQLCVMAAEEFLSPSECFMLEVAGLLHDIWKLGVPDAVLLKPGPLNEDDWKLMRHHSAMALSIISSAFSCPTVAETVRYQACWYIGRQDEPEMPIGKHIPVSSRILAIADAFTSMTCDRPYRTAMSRQDAFKELRRCSGTQFDPLLVETFIRKVTEGDQNSSRRVPAGYQAALVIGNEVSMLLAALNAGNFREATVLAEHLAGTAAALDCPDIACIAAEVQHEAQFGLNTEKVFQLAADLSDLCKANQQPYLEVSALT